MSLIIASAYIIDIITLENVLIKHYIIGALTITVIGLVLDYLKITSINQSFQIIIYTLVACVIGCYLMEHTHTMDAEIFHHAAIIGALIPVSGFVLGKETRTLPGRYLVAV